MPLDHQERLHAHKGTQWIWLEREVGWHAQGVPLGTRDPFCENEVLVCLRL